MKLNYKQRTSVQKSIIRRYLHTTRLLKQKSIYNVRFLHFSSQSHQDSYKPYSSFSSNHRCVSLPPLYVSHYKFITYLFLYLYFLLYFLYLGFIFSTVFCKKKPNGIRLVLHHNVSYIDPVGHARAKCSIEQIYNGATMIVSSLHRKCASLTSATGG